MHIGSRIKSVLAAACLAVAGAVCAAHAQAPGLFGPAAPAVNELKVTFCGTSGPLPIANRAKSCVAIQAGGALYLVDIGPEANKNLMLWRLPLASARAVFITHMHSDHIGDLGEFNMQSWVAGRPKPLVVVGPEGVDQLTSGFNQAYALDHGYRRAHHEHDGVVMSIPASMLEPRTVIMPAKPDAEGVIRQTVWSEGGLTVTAIAVNHFPIVPAFAYRFDYKGRSVVVSGDTIKWPPLATASKGADVLIHEAQNADMTRRLAGMLKGAGQPRIGSILADTLTYHTTPVEAAEIARDAHVKALVLTHLTQAGLPFYTPEIFTKGMDVVGFANWKLAEDGMTIDLPVGGEAVVFGRR